MDQPVPKLSEGDEIMRMAAWRRKRRRTRRGTWNASVITTVSGAVK